MIVIPTKQPGHLLIMLSHADLDRLRAGWPARLEAPELFDVHIMACPTEEEGREALLAAGKERGKDFVSVPPQEAAAWLAAQEAKEGGGK